MHAELRAAKHVKFLVDENLGEATALALRDDGINAEFGPDVGLGGKSDETVFQYAWRTKRVILTHDSDFLDDRRFPENRNPGVIVLPGGSGDYYQLMGALFRVIWGFGIKVSRDRR